MGSLWGKECVQDDSVTVIVPVFEWVKCFDGINRTMQQSWRGESVQSHVITQAGVSYRTVAKESDVNKSPTSYPVKSQGLKPPNVPCILCQENHVLFVCETFKSMSPKEKHDLAVQWSTDCVSIAWSWDMDVLIVKDSPSALSKIVTETTQRFPTMLNRQMAFPRQKPKTLTRSLLVRTRL